MAFHKVAFAHREHRRITEYIMGPRFDEALFEEVHRYIDGKGGLGHREKHGHNEEAERFVQKKWGDIAVEIFKIHIFSDALYDGSECPCTVCTSCGKGRLPRLESMAL